MGTFITTAILTLILLPLVLGAIIKAAGASGHYLRKKTGAPGAPEPPKEKGRGLRAAGPWALAWAVGVVAFCLISLASSYTQVEAGTVGVVKRLGKVQSTTFSPGFHFKLPFVDQVVLYSTKVTSYEASENPDTSRANYVDLTVDSTTDDGQTVQLTFTVLFRIPAEGAADIAQTVGDMDAVVENVIKAFARSISREVPKSFSAEELYTQNGQAEAQQVIQDRLKEAFGRHGVAIDQYLIRRISFAAEYVAAVEAKQIAKQNALTEQNNIARQEAIKQQTIINAQGEAEKKKIEAAGEAEAITLKQAAIAQNPLIIQYEFVQKLSPNINWGVLPDSVVPFLDANQLMGTGSTTSTTAGQ